MATTKYDFTPAQRYAVWMHHDKRCWFCDEPLGFKEATVDHVIPETLLSEPEKLAQIIADYDLPTGFRINGYENWLPAHAKCNQEKNSRVFKMIPSYRVIFDELLKRANKVRRTAEVIGRDEKKARVLTRLLTAIEDNKVSIVDVMDIVSAYAGVADPGVASTPQLFMRLDNGYFINRENIAFEGWCECDRDACVGKSEKVYCYWPSHLSSWVQRKHLYFRCYDEVIRCPRCGQDHRRGDVGRQGDCTRPYDDQDNQVDLRGNANA